MSSDKKIYPTPYLVNILCTSRKLSKYKSNDTNKKRTVLGVSCLFTTSDLNYSNLNYINIKFYPNKLKLDNY